MRLWTRSPRVGESGGSSFESSEILQGLGPVGHIVASRADGSWEHHDQDAGQRPLVRFGSLGTVLSAMAFAGVSAGVVRCDDLVIYSVRNTLRDAETLADRDQSFI